MTDERTQAVYPVRLHSEGDRLAIEWSDGVRQVVSWANIRKHCPCAGCRMERDRPAPLLPILKPGEDQPARPVAMEPVGRYAYKIVWNDGHDTGLYTFELLRQLGASEEQR